MNRSTAVAICSLILVGCVLLVSAPPVGVVFFAAWAVINWRNRRARELTREQALAEHRRIYGF